MGVVGVDRSQLGTTAAIDKSVLQGELVQKIVRSYGPSVGGNRNL